MSANFGRRGHPGDALSGLLDGELAPARAAAASAHVLACPQCAAELHAVGQARAWVRALPPADPPPGFYGRVVLTRPAAPLPVGLALRRRAGLVALGAAAAATTVLGVGTPRPSPVLPVAPRTVEARATSAPVGADLITKLAPVGVPVSFGR